MAFNIFDVEPLSPANPVCQERHNAFSRWISELPDEPGSISLTFGLLDSMPYKYEWTPAPAGDIVTVNVALTDLLRTTVIAECDDTLAHPRAAELCNEPGFFRSGQDEALLAACTLYLPLIQTQVLSALFSAVGWDVEEWLSRNTDTVGGEAASQYVIDKALQFLVCGLDGDRVDVEDVPVGPLLDAGILSVDDVEWLQSVVDDATRRMRQVEASL